MKPVTMVLEALAQTRGRRLLDIGCGPGVLGQKLREHGVDWTGIDPQGGAGVITARAESLPFDSGTFDLVLFQNALHHIPVARMDDALAEAERVLAPGGLILVIEPAVHGALSAVLAVVDDETEIREAAQRAITRATSPGAPLYVLRHDQPIRQERIADFETFVSRMIAVDAERAEAAHENNDALRTAFRMHAQYSAGEGYVMDQPMKLHLLARA